MNHPKLFLKKYFNYWNYYNCVNASIRLKERSRRLRLLLPQNKSSKQKDRQIEKQIDGQINRQIDRQIDVQIDRCIDRQIYVQIDRQKDRQMDRQIYKIDKYITRYIGVKGLVLVSGRDKKSSKFKERQRNRQTDQQKIVRDVIL